MAFTYTEYLKEVYLPEVISTIFWNDVFFRSPFEVVQPANCPGGPSININLEYATSTSSGIYTQGAPMPASDSLSNVRAYFTKDFFQGSALVYGDTQAMVKNGEGVNNPLEPVKLSIETSVKNLVNTMHSTFLTDLAAQVDDSTAFSDASLSRSDYSIASYEADASAALTRAHLDAAILALTNTTNGFVDRSDLVICCAPNQRTRIANIAGAQYNESNLIVNAGELSNIDSGRVFRTASYDGIDIFEIPGMTSTEVYILRKSQTKIFLHSAMEIKEKSTEQWAEQYLITAGANLVVKDPKRCAKITGCTA